MKLLIDNYDSLSYNLYQLVGELNSDIRVVRNDELTVSEIVALNPERIIISPGPCRPEDAGNIVEVARKLTGSFPILGVCLGHQAICAAFGANVTYSLDASHSFNVMTYMDCFEKALGNGKDILYLCFSTGLSKTLQNAKYCAELLKQDYPDRRIIVVDTLCASAGEGFLVREAARKQAEGVTMDELAEWVLAHRLKVCHWFTVDTFDHLRHGGRVSAASAAIGNVLSIKPLLHVDGQGHLQVAKKPRGQRQAMRELLAHLDAGWNPDLGRAILVAHGDNPDGAAALTAEIRSNFPDADLIQGTIGPVIGAHTGPGMLAVIYWGTNR